MGKESVEIIGYCGGMFLLASLVKEDVEERKVSVRKILVFAVFAGIYVILVEQLAWQDIGRRLWPGMSLLLLAFCTKESIGYGDGAAVLVLGLWTGAWFVLKTVVAAFILAGFYGGICIFRRKTEPMPFVPFLLLGMEVILFEI